MGWLLGFLGGALLIGAAAAVIVHRRGSGSAPGDREPGFLAGNEKLGFDPYSKRDDRDGF
jgi:hypothetical protein